jgi:hypothetical protein
MNRGLLSEPTVIVVLALTAKVCVAVAADLPALSPQPETVRLRLRRPVKHQAARIEKKVYTNQVMRCLYFMVPVWMLLLLVVGALAAGCGGEEAESDADQGRQVYGEILHGLKKAALTHVGYGRYNAVDRAESLKPTLRASLDAFCEVAQEMVINEEGGKAAETPYYLTRIKLRAERELPFVSTAPVNTAVSELAAVLNLYSFDASAVRSYEKACYHRQFWY